ncbi:eukaryotic elongation factor 5A hypusine, DNA-binding OB fold-domain-containing protein [Aspergillus keveii]|uniref:Eukaryotic translation initiation factor 5A n=1 Tax=Aspergillus keveii TaxID=714993 RepID=A0ABR4FWE0_9EURO
MSRAKLPRTLNGEGQTISVDNSHLRKGGHSTSQTGKHRHSKIHLIGIDIFTGKKFESVVVSTAKSDAPVVSRDEYQLVGIKGGSLVLKDSDGNTKDNVPVPEYDIGQAIQGYVEKGESATVTVIRVMGQEACIGVKATK